jgi:predicted  nucleic acid-binding Zn-ribbon protein
MSVAGEESDAETPLPSVFHTVRCLGCGVVYPKPARDGIVAANPGCPQCGYVGWLTTSVATALALRRRFAADHRRRRSA